MLFRSFSFLLTDFSKQKKTLLRKQLLLRPSTRKIQGKTPWVDQSCADCPGFPALGAGDAPPPEVHPGASERAPGLAFAFMALQANSWICCPQLPYHPCKSGTHSTCFCSTRRHTPKDPTSFCPESKKCCNSPQALI